MLFICIFIASILLVTLSIPPIIKLALKKRLFDAPVESRKVHKRVVPNLGGIAIVASFLFSCSFFIRPSLLPEASLLISAGLILFLTGLKDDLVSISPLKKFIAQFSSALIVTLVLNIRIFDLQGMLDVSEMDYFASLSFSILFIVGVINSFNLIDGIDGLAGMIGVIMSLVFSALFYQAGEFGWSYMALALTGSLIGFLIYNVTPAKIFMGDSGSLLVGFLAAVMSIKFINLAMVGDISIGSIKITSAVALVLSILIVPLFDTMRVFTLRMVNNVSPFKADKNHIHHRLLFIGFTHTQSTLILSLITIIFLMVAMVFQDLGNTQLVTLLATMVLLSNSLFSLYIAKYKANGNVLPSVRKSISSKNFSKEILEKISEN